MNWSAIGRARHRAPGRPIQPQSTFHEADYADYSHGVRLVSDTVTVNGRTQSIVHALEDAAEAPALSYEGKIADVDRVMHRDETAQQK